MLKQKFCQDCDQSHNCQEVYRRLGKVQGPSVVLKVVAAFLLPLMVFIAALAVFERVLASVIDTKGLQTVFSFLLALSVAAVYVLITKAINRQLGKNK